MDRYERIERDVKKFVEDELKTCKRGSINNRAIAYGALMFASNYLFPSFNYKLSDWWNNEMWDKFTDKIAGAKGDTI